MKAARIVTVVAACALALSQCRVQDTKQNYEFIVRVVSDPGRPLPNASLFSNEALIGTTKDDGTRRFAIRGVEGEVYAINVRCPEGYRSPPAPISVVLRRLSDPSRSPEYSVSCPPTTRSVVVSIRAENGRNLPVIHLGREIARTDESGAAHVLLSMAPDETFELKLDTTEKGNERLRPQSPTARFAVRNQDEVFVFDQKFVLEPERSPRAVKPRGPTPIPTPLR